MIYSQPWRPRLRGRSREHRPVQVCETCRQNWPCDHEQDRAERMRRIADMNETLIAARRKP